MTSDITQRKVNTTGNYPVLTQPPYAPPEYILGQFRLKIFPRPKCYAKHIFVYFSYGSILPDRPAKTQNLNSFELSQFYPT